MGRSRFHALMYPWFATGHMTPFLYPANKLAERGHMVTFLLPKKALKQLEHLNLFPHNIVFRSVTVPHVDGLPLGTETASEIPVSTTDLLMSAMDLTRDQVEVVVRAVEPDLIFFDFAHWIPEVARDFGLKTVKYVVVSASTIANMVVPGGELGVPPPGYPSTKVLLRKQDAYTMKKPDHTIDVGPNFFERVTTSLLNCDVVAIRTAREIEGNFCDYIEKHCRKKVLLTGTLFPEPDKTIQLEERWVKWLSGFEPESVVFCALGSQVILEKDQFQELCLGMELTGSPFLVAVKPPRGSSTVQEALPEGFEERVKGRGVVWGGWVQQPLILSHPSVGCFVSHCGFGSMWESLLSDCQIVLVPQLVDQVLNTRLLSDELKVSVEVVRENTETGWFSKESLRDAINSVMNKDSEIGNLVKKNHTKWRETLASPGFMTDYVDKFIESLKDLVSGTNHD
ncbi:PREDICTED: LOW QUALITY PROTEIN: UDP-glycosyltransferase 79B3-like [Camelina sativa]|uniref:Glycosyltransferase n=1 Tax=Camelina sativa TaxID=90675 RepID=A0ABM0TYQ9_CAMSA|nr:PREDICTED: LOW QUALITY PROTEIN: UDP-glycosyltransferase 79B3-like [Camelina sativa]